MKKILWFTLILFMAFAFVGCKEEGPSMNEDYAGTWYYSDSLGVERYDFTDTTFVIASYAEGYGYVEYMKGTLTKKSDTIVEFDITHVNNGTSWDEFDYPAYESTYSLSADGHTLTIDGDELTDTDPTK